MDEINILFLPTQDGDKTQFPHYKPFWNGHSWELRTKKKKELTYEQVKEMCEDYIFPDHMINLEKAFKYWLTPEILYAWLRIIYSYHSAFLWDSFNPRDKKTEKSADNAVTQLFEELM